MKLIAGAALAAGCAVASANSVVMEIIKESHDRLRAQGFLKAEKPASVLGQPQTCRGGFVQIGGENFPCKAVDFYSYLSQEDLHIETIEIDEELENNDIWGWLSPNGKEVTFVGMATGFAAVDTTDPVQPCILAKYPTGREPQVWGDQKVYKNTLYQVKDKRGGDSNATRNYGVEVYDLLPLDQLDCKKEGYIPPYIAPQNIFRGHGRSHNLAVNTESGKLYSVGSEQCAGGLVVMDIAQNRLNPVQVGCVDGDGYTHDALCLTYDGPDAKHQNKEICFAFNEDTLTIWDLSDLAAPKMLSRTAYPNQAYSHQGWLLNDMKHILLDDELDELCNSDHPHPRCPELVKGNLTGLRRTSTNVFNVEDLENPVFEGIFVHKDESIDHNLYVWGLIHRKGWGGNPPLDFYPDPSFAYLHNYLAGLRILDVSTGNVADFKEVGYFDVSPDRTEVEFAGMWSGYMHPSGVYAVNSIERGLFLLQPRMAFTDAFPAPPASTPSSDAPIPTVSIVLVAILALAGTALLAYVLLSSRPAKASVAKEEEKKEEVSAPTPASENVATETL